MKVTLPIWLSAIGMIVMNGVALAGPAAKSAASDSFPLLDSEASVVVSEIITAQFQTGFALNELGRVHPSPVRPIAAMPYPHGRPGQDVSEFISARWLEEDADVLALSSSRTDGYELANSTFARAASPEMDVLSVPHIPLPAGIVPGVIGVAMAAYVHHRSLKSRKS